jgi:hypothetical protein
MLKILTVSIDPARIERIDNEAEAKGVSRSHFCIGSIRGVSHV